MLKIVPEILAFLRNLEPGLDPRKLHIPCYHIIKEHELLLMMRHCSLAAKALGEMSNRPPPLYRDQRPVRKAGRLRNNGQTLP